MFVSLILASTLSRYIRERVVECAYRPAAKGVYFVKPSLLSVVVLGPSLLACAACTTPERPEIVAMWAFGARSAPIEIHQPWIIGRVQVRF